DTQTPRLAVGDLDDGEAEAAEDFEVDAGIAANVGDTPDEEHRDVDATLHERPRDHEPVAAVVAAAAQHPYVAFGQVAVNGFHRGHRLAAGVFHENQRRNSDVLDGAAIGFPHLGGVENSHL